MLVSFFVNFAQTIFISKEEIWSDMPVGKSMREFSSLMIYWECPVYCGQCHPWAPGLYKINKLGDP